MDGVNDYISLPALEFTGQAFTIAAWLRNTGFPTGVLQRFIAKATGSNEQDTYWMLGLADTSGQNRLRFRLKTGSTTTLTASSGNLPLNTWYHAAATYDGARMRLYLNGNLVGSIAKSGSMARGSGVPVHIGRSPEGSRYLQGAIDDVRIYATAATRSEILSIIAAAGLPPNQPPAVSLSSPANGASFPAGTSITVSATASDANGTVASVKFYAGSALIGTVTSSPYSVSWPKVAAGSYSLTAVATDNAGAMTTSSARTITVTTSTPPPPNQPPLVSLTSPSSGAAFTAPATIALNASASDPDGSVTQVDFYRGSTLIGSDSSSPYTFSWTNALVGSYSLTAVARDNSGATTVSSTRDITVRSATLPTTLMFTPSSNHSTAVDHYVLEIFTAGADPTLANPAAARDVGKPSISGGQISVDVTSTVTGLAPGNYVATVTAFGDGGSTQSAPSPQFTR
jgi:hypothetical protein